MARRPTETLDDLLTVTEKTLSALALAAGVARRTLYGARIGRMPRRDTIVKLARALDVDPARLRAAIEASRTAK